MGKHTKTTKTKAAHFKSISKKKKGATGGKNIQNSARRKSSGAQISEATKRLNATHAGPGIS